MRRWRDVGLAGLVRIGSGEMPLSDEQRRKIREYFQTNSANEGSSDFGISIGAAVPRQIALQALPADVAEIAQLAEA